METLQELVAQRRGYKFLAADGTSPYQKYKYDLKSRLVMVTNLDVNPSFDCGAGWNLATLKWIGDNCLKLDGIIIECSIPKTAKICVPNNSDGKFRTDKMKIKKIHRIDSAFPLLKNIEKRLKDYKPTNPINAEKMPEPNKIKMIMAQVGAQVWAQIRDQVGAQVGASVRAQVGAQVGVCTYKALAEFFDITYVHSAFELIRLGIIVVNVLGKFKVFGKNGKYLGEVTS
jgi:hypothetical protein